MPRNHDIDSSLNANSDHSSMSFETDCVHFGEDRRAQLGAATPPIYQVSTFTFPNSAAFERRMRGNDADYIYTRVGNPTTAVLERKLARLERGNWSKVFGSGMGAISAAINACVSAGSHVVAVSRSYHPTREYLKHIARFGVTTTFVAGQKPEDLAAAIRPETKLLYLESPTTGHFDVLDVPAITAIARDRKIATIFDNSWATPYFQSPLDLGADLIVHSATKYIGGHSDVVAGVVAGRDEDLRKRVMKEVELLGATIDPFAAWLLLRGLRTLPVRMEYHQRSALEIARFLAAHPAVERVNHPGLDSHPGHRLARGQLRGYSGLFSFKLREQTRERTHAVIDRLKLFSIGVSWGGHESLVVGGPFFSDDATNPEWLIRLHVGLETTTDLIADLRKALE